MSSLPVPSYPEPPTTNNYMTKNKHMVSMAQMRKQCDIFQSPTDTTDISNADTTEKCISNIKMVYLYSAMNQNSVYFLVARVTISTNIYSTIGFRVVIAHHRGANKENISENKTSIIIIRRINIKKRDKPSHGEIRKIDTNFAQLSVHRK
jgi:hypothetical protein